MAKEAKGLWDTMLDKITPGPAAAQASPQASAFTSPEAKAAQARSLSYYMRTADDSKQLQDFINDPSLK